MTFEAEEPVLLEKPFPSQTYNCQENGPFPGRSTINNESYSIAHCFKKKRKSLFSWLCISNGKLNSESYHLALDMSGLG
jgi:hypothetical protein